VKFASLPRRGPKGRSGELADIDGIPSRIGCARRVGTGLLSIALALSCAACGGSPPVLTALRTEQQAQEHCPKDTIVWLDPQSGMYQLKGHGSYGLSGAGRYACRSEAEGAGMHAMAN